MLRSFREFSMLVHVVYGPNRIERDINGDDLTVGKLQEVVKDAFGFRTEENLSIFVESEEVDPDYQLSAGDHVEFRKKTGQKG